MAQDLSPLSIAVALAAFVLGPTLAPLVGTYALILVGWFGGVLVGVYRRDPKSRMGTLVFCLVTLVLTVGLAVPVAVVISPYIGTVSAALLFPVAFLIPAIGESWIPIGRWLLLFTKRLINNRGKQK